MNRGVGGGTWTLSATDFVRILNVLFVRYGFHSFISVSLVLWHFAVSNCACVSFYVYM